MTQALRFDPIRLPPEIQALRLEARELLADCRARGVYGEKSDAPRPVQMRAFAKEVAKKGWIGMTWPKEYGGRERSFLERYVISEEILVDRAPNRTFFVADRQSGPTLIRYGSEAIKRRVLPQVVAGEAMFCIGMSEPNSGSDLFAARAKAERVEGGWRLTGTKIWTSGAETADWMIGLFRSSPPTNENRRHGLTSFLVDMHAPGIEVRPIRQMTGEDGFNEVIFDGVFLPDEQVIGEIDAAWKQATSELAYERSGPERFLETWPALRALAAAVPPEPDDRTAEGLGRLVAQVHALRRMSVSVAGMLEAGREPVTEAAIVKDLGTVWEKRLPAEVRRIAALLPPEARDGAFQAVLDHETRVAPKLTIQGGSTEILRGIVARGLGLR